MNDDKSMTIHTHPALSLASALNELARFIEQMSDDEFILIRQDLFTSSIGGQTRHTLDHVRIFLEGVETGIMDYDNRQRGTTIEKNRSEALYHIAELEKKLLCITMDQLDRDVHVKVYLDSKYEPIELRSTIGREIGFVLSHTIHHNALVSAMLKDLGISVTATFGYAPSTIAYQNTI